MKNDPMNLIPPLPSLANQHTQNRKPYYYKEDDPQDIFVFNSLLIKEQAILMIIKVGVPVGHRICKAVQHRLINPISPLVGLSSTPKHHELGDVLSISPFLVFDDNPMINLQNGDGLPLDMCMI